MEMETDGMMLQPSGTGMPSPRTNMVAEALTNLRTAVEQQFAQRGQQLEAALAERVNAQDERVMAFAAEIQTLRDAFAAELAAIRAEFAQSIAQLSVQTGSRSVVKNIEYTSNGLISRIVETPQ